jgi:fatty-acyl-CoA synthase
VNEGSYGRAATAATIDHDGWVHTGDLAIRRADGCYKIAGRLKDMIIRGGENIYPREIEEFLFTHSAVAQVASFGVPDPKYGEELCVWVQLRPGHTATADDIRAFCKENVAHYKVPRYVKFVTEFSDDRQRKNPEIQDARNHVRRTEPERSGYGMMGLIIDCRLAC